MEQYIVVSNPEKKDVQFTVLYVYISANCGRALWAW